MCECYENNCLSHVASDALLVSCSKTHNAVFVTGAIAQLATSDYTMWEYSIIMCCSNIANATVADVLRFVRRNSFLH